MYLYYVINILTKYVYELLTLLGSQDCLTLDGSYVFYNKLLIFSIVFKL